MKRYRLYIDESGDHTRTAFTNVGKQYLGLTGIALEQEYYRCEFYPKLEQMKQEHFPHNPDEPIILHRKELVQQKYPFGVLRDQAKQNAFNDAICTFLSTAQYILFTVIVDKKAQVDRYQQSAFHPYHYCLTALLERYCGFLNFYNACGDVLAESRGKTEDTQLKEAYRLVYEDGTYFRAPTFFQHALTSKNIKIKLKSANVAGLQIADLLAHPCKNEVLLDQGCIPKRNDHFGIQISNCLQEKYNRHSFRNQVDGYGKIFLG